MVSKLGNGTSNGTSNGTIHLPQNGNGGLVLDPPVDDYEDLVRRQLVNLGHDVHSDGLAETPARVARFHQLHFQHVEDPIAEAALSLKPFDAPGNSGLVSIRCSFSAFCEHHLLPFFGTAQVVYQPDKKVTGLSKISRIITSLCSRPQIQERITSETAEVMMKLEPVGVLVDMVAEHTCMRVRGVNDPCSSARTRVAAAQFKENTELRNEAIAMLD